MKLVGGDLGQFEEEEFVEEIIIAPAVRYFVDVYFEKSGNYNLMNINPHKSYTLGRIKVSKESTSVSYKENFFNDLFNKEVIEDISQFEKYFDKEVDYELDLTVDLGKFLETMESLPCVRAVRN